MSLINDALKKAQQKRAEEAAAQTPAVPPPRPAKDTISQPHPDDNKRKIPAPPPPANRPQLPIPPPPAAGTRRLPPIVNYSIPQIDPAEQPATPSDRPRVSSSIRYNASGFDEPGQPRSSSIQKTFWIILGCIAAIAIIVRLVVTMGRDDTTASKLRTEQTPPPQVVVAPPMPSLPPPTPPVLPTARETAVVRPASSPQETSPAPEPAVTEAEPPLAISFPTKPAATKSAPAPTSAVTTKPPALAVSLPPATPEAAAPEAGPAQPQSATPILPPIYALRPPAPVTNATRIQNFIDRLRVTGVRISDTGSKVILNDRLFSVGETVDVGLELKLVKIEHGMITFSDPGGKKYVKLYQ